MSMLDVPPPGAMLPARLSGLPFVGLFLAFRRRDAGRPSPPTDGPPNSSREAGGTQRQKWHTRDLAGRIRFRPPLSTLAPVGSAPTAVRTATACRPPVARWPVLIRGGAAWPRRDAPGAAPPVIVCRFPAPALPSFLSSLSAHLSRACITGQRSHGVRDHEHAAICAGVRHPCRPLHQLLFALLDHVVGVDHVSLHAAHHRLHVLR
eukprot:scaffold9392_cov120-Isochrysis_galbana.AAC.1